MLDFDDFVGCSTKANKLTPSSCSATLCKPVALRHVLRTVDPPSSVNGEDGLREEELAAGAWQRTACAGHGREGAGEEGTDPRLCTCRARTKATDSSRTSPW